MYHFYSIWFIISFIIPNIVAESNRVFRINQNMSGQYIRMKNVMSQNDLIYLDVLCEDLNKAVIEINWYLVHFDSMKDYEFSTLLDVGKVIINGILIDSLTSKVNSLSSVKTLNSTATSSNVTTKNYFYGNFQYQWNINQFECQQNLKIFFPYKKHHKNYFTRVKFQNQIYEFEKFNLIDEHTDYYQELKDESIMLNVWSDGLYWFMVSFKSADYFSLKGTLQMHGLSGFLNPLEYPTYPVSGVLTVVYMLLATIWIVVWARSQEHTKRIHIILGVLTLIGGLGNLCLFIHFANMNVNAIGVTAINWTGVVIIVSQISLVVFLLMIVSTGYGINRPELSKPILTAMILLTILNFIGKFLEQVYSTSFGRLYDLSAIFNSIIMLIAITLIMFFSITTFIHLYHRRNSSRYKFIGFSIFMICCITVFILHLVQTVYILLDRIVLDNQENWKLKWLVDFLTQMQMFTLLSAIMYLWQPMDENQSYAFQLLNNDDKEDNLVDDMSSNVEGYKSLEEL